MKHLGANGAFAHSQNRGDLRVGVPLHVEEHHRKTPAGRQAIERLAKPAGQLQPFAFLVRARLLRRDAERDRAVERLGAPHRTPAVPVQCRVHHDAEQPRREGATAIEFRQRDERGQERILCGVVGIVPIAQHRARDPARLAGITLNEDAERGALAAKGERDQGRVVAFKRTTREEVISLDGGGQGPSRDACADFAARSRA